MIQMQTKLDVADNTGAKVVQCIHVLGGSKRRYAQLGDIIVCSVKKALPSSEIKPGTVVKTSKGRPMAKGVCPECGTTVNRFLSQKASKE